ncbi:hypothetical protein EX30DRAFT_339083 [Ascodesmis nigricans]|uniref:Uncharacterized protein n=1 Tax=Ascodesmis nigricans TaxID=341454 RepID=A0A4V3SJ65_9PEZI|nr:hypothetical protein EX30DRAFT_339083 [Ascodesmis nigricans]
MTISISKPCNRTSPPSSSSPFANKSTHNTQTSSHTPSSSSSSLLHLPPHPPCNLPYNPLDHPLILQIHLPLRSMPPINLLPNLAPQFFLCDNLPSIPFFCDGEAGERVVPLATEVGGEGGV